MKEEDLPQKLFCLIYKLKFQEEEKEILQVLTLVENSFSQLKSSSDLAILLKLVLEVGNIASDYGAGNYYYHYFELIFFFFFFFFFFFVFL